jgi:hypothetical protein
LKQPGTAIVNDFLKLTYRHAGFARLHSDKALIFAENVLYWHHNEHEPEIAPRWELIFRDSPGKRCQGA